RSGPGGGGRHRLLQVLRRAHRGPGAQERGVLGGHLSELLDRLLARDASLWPEGNVSASRLGWLDVPERMREESIDLRRWAETVDARHVLLLGMGGSSLGSEVLRAAEDDGRLIVLDTTDPATAEGAPLDDTFFLVSSKSGTT